MGIFSQLRFAEPPAFLLLGLLPLLWIRWRKRSRTVILWRSLILFLLVLSLADPRRVSEFTRTVEEEIERLFVFDLSRSIPEPMRRWMRRTAEEKYFLTDRDRTFVFGGKMREVKDWQRWLREKTPAEVLQPTKTDLESLFTMLMDLPAKPRKIFLFSDGWENQGKARTLLPSLSLSSLQVFPILPASRPEFANVVVKRIVAPHHGESGAGIHLRLLVENHDSQITEGEILLKRNGQLFKRKRIEIKPGSQIFSYPATLPEEEIASFQATFVPQRGGSDRIAHDNQSSAWVAVQRKAKVLIVSGQRKQGEILEKVLKRLGYQTTSVALHNRPPAPGDFAAVVFNNAARERFPQDYLSAIESYVAGGGSFLMLGGEESFGAGGYRGTPIGDLLPVKLKEPKKEEKNRAIVLVIDKSGSMRREKKLLYAKEAIKALAGKLLDDDLLGVVGFDISPFIVVPLGPMADLRTAFASRIDRLRPGGKTYLYPALVEAKRQLERKKASWKHVIVLSDGETGGSGSDYIDLVSVMKMELKMTVSAVAIGGQANIRLLRRLARYGGGLFHHTYDPSTLPGIILQEIKEQPQEEPFVEKDLVPELARNSPVLRRFRESRIPTLQGYVGTDIKKRGDLDLIVRVGAKQEPLLASWSYGNGRAVSFATDLHGRWTKGWIKWRDLERFWRHVFDWMIPPKASLPPYEVRVNLLEDRPVLDLYLYGNGEEPDHFRFSLKGKNGDTGQGVLEKIAQGHYRTALPISRPGDYRVGLIEERAGKRIPYPPVGYTLPFDPSEEIPQGHFNSALLENIARSSGGGINPPAQPGLKTGENLRISKSLRSYSILLALVLFLLEMIFRRFVFRLSP